jgi:hypothetical protein
MRFCALSVDISIYLFNQLLLYTLVHFILHTHLGSYKTECIVLANKHTEDGLIRSKRVGLCRIRGTR